MRRILTLALSAAVCLSLCSCGGTPSAPNGGVPVESAEPTPESAVLVAAELDSASCEPERSIKTFQDIASFLVKRMDWKETEREFQAAEEDGAAIMEATVCCP